MVSVTFSALGILVGLWAEEFEHISIWTNFILTPLIFFGGVFHSITMVPKPLQMVTVLNPIYYMVNGFRYGALGIYDTNVMASAAIVTLLAVTLSGACVHLFRIGYKLRS